MLIPSDYNRCAASVGRCPERSEAAEREEGRRGVAARGHKQPDWLAEPASLPGLQLGPMP